ncbi:MAG TPA: hypothetical protein VE981_19920 [Planctomycetota bacterium]|nr:hypothetical protein [Planctomycetota bacterium]
MPAPPLHRFSGLYLSWIGALCGAVIVLLYNLLPFPLTFATPGLFFLSIVQVEVFFALLIWPLFVPDLKRAGVRGAWMLAPVAILILFALPIALIGANVSSVPPLAVVRSQALVAGLAALSAGMASRLRAAMPWYLLALFLLSTVPPFLLFLNSQLLATVPSVSPYMSPFWSAASDGPPGWVLAGVGAVAGLGLLAWKEPA